MFTTSDLKNESSPIKIPKVVEDEKDFMTKVKEGIVSYVNTKLNGFSNPVLFATSILSCVLLAFILLLVLSLVNCPITSNMSEKITYNTGDATMQKDFLDAILSPPDAQELKDAGITRTASVCILEASNLRPDGSTVGYKNCLIAENQDLKMMGWQTGWCKGAREKAQLTWDGDTLACDDKPGMVFTTKVVETVKTEQTVCPTFGAALGSSLAYISYLELLFTAIVGFAYIHLGIVKPNNSDASLMMLLKSASSTKIEAEVESLRKDVDDIMGTSASIDVRTVDITVSSEVDSQ